MEMTIGTGPAPVEVEITPAEYSVELEAKETFIKGDKGDDGYTPIKGIDYFDGKDGYTPVKGVDYFDGVDGQNGRDGQDGYTPRKGIDYFDGQNGKDGKDGKNGSDYVITQADYEQIASLVPTPDTSIFATKDYVENEIATFDFIKIVDALPTTGLPNRTYLLAKGTTDNNDLYDEYLWVDNKWELLGNKKIEVDLTNYALKSDVSTIQGYFKSDAVKKVNRTGLGGKDTNDRPFVTINSGLNLYYSDVFRFNESTKELKIDGNPVALAKELPTDNHINSLIDTKLGVIENGTY